MKTNSGTAIVALGLAGIMAGCSSNDNATQTTTVEKAKTPAIQTAEAPQGHLRNSSEPGQLNVHYQTASWTLHNNDLTDLGEFVRANPEANSMLVEGHCDRRGSDAYNLDLGKRRAGGVEKRLRDIGFRGNIQSTSYGEGKPIVQGSDPGAHQLNRRVLVMAGQQVITRALELLEGDVYLVDASGSMSGDKWGQVAEFDYPSGSDLYGFNGDVGLKELDSPSDINPGGGTPLWDSAYSLLGRVDEGDRLTLLTDGEDTGSTHSPQQVIDLADDRDIKISTIGIGVNQNTQRDLTRVARETGGSFYLGN